MVTSRATITGRLWNNLIFMLIKSWSQLTTTGKGSQIECAKRMWSFHSCSSPIECYDKVGWVKLKCDFVEGPWFGLYKKTSRWVKFSSVHSYWIDNIFRLACRKNKCSVDRLIWFYSGLSMTSLTSHPIFRTYSCLSLCTRDMIKIKTYICKRIMFSLS